MTQAAPLHYAALHGKRDVVELLIKKGANGTYMCVCVSLCVCVCFDVFCIWCLHVCMYVSDVGLRLVDAVDEEGLAPLHMALEDGHDDVVAALLTAKANPNIASASGQVRMIVIMLTPYHVHIRVCCC